MGKYERARQKIGYGVPHGQTPRNEIGFLIEHSFDQDPIVRSAVAKNLCPCHVRTNVPEVWNRLIEMTTDPEPVVRRDVVHALADGSPRDRAHEIAAALEPLYNDVDPRVRKMVRKVISAYRESGRVNVL
jgi:hypothetical protein